MGGTTREKMFEQMFPANPPLGFRWTNGMACLRIWYPPAVQISMPDSGDIDRFGKILVCTVFKQSHLSSTSPVSCSDSNGQHTKSGACRFGASDSARTFSSDRGHGSVKDFDKVPAALEALFQPKRTTLGYRYVEVPNSETAGNFMTKRWHKWLSLNKYRSDNSCDSVSCRKTRDSKRHTVDEPIHSQALCEICNGVEDRKNEVLQCPETTILTE